MIRTVEIKRDVTSRASVGLRPPPDADGFGVDVIDAIEANLAVEPSKGRRGRRMGRLVLAALETGASFGRGDLTVDPVSWFTRPLELFGGRRALDACQDREHLERLLLLHGLGLGDDAKAEDVDLLRAGTGKSSAMPSQGRIGHRRDRQGEPRIRLVGGGRPEHRLWTASTHLEGDDGVLQVFWAMMEVDERSTRSRIGRYYGEVDARHFMIRCGFDWSEPLANALVSGATAHLLDIAAMEPASPIAVGLDVRLEQRFTA